MDNVDSLSYESLIPLMEQMEILLPVNNDVANGPPPREEQQRLLRDARAKRDVFAEEKVRVENLLSSALEKVKLYQTLLGVTESKLCYVEDLIGSIRFRLQQRGFPTRTVTSLLPASDETTRNPENNRPSVTVN